jgi:RNA polymerase sigma-70 factor (ECF subfamily)
LIVLLGTASGVPCSEKERWEMTSHKLEFHDVYKEFHERVHLYLERMVGKDDVEDLTQEVFMKIDKGLKEFKGQSKLSTWIYRIATNAALDKLKSRAYQEQKNKISLSAENKEAESEDSSVLVAEKTLSAEREAVRNEMNECIREFVDKLSDNYKTVIILSEFKDLQNQQIADILSISLDAVKIRLHRARARLKAEFEAGCEFYYNENNELACDRKNKKKEQ